MTLTEIRAAQHEDERLQSDEAALAFLLAQNPRHVHRDLTAHFSPVERQMYAHVQRRQR